MNAISVSSTGRTHVLLPWLLVFGAAVIAVGSARPWAGSWNDGSRLAAVESITDRGTTAIDDSMFVRVPHRPQSTPYPPNEPALFHEGTKDKLFIDGHFYSDKPYVVSFLMAGLYKGGRVLGLPAATDRPDLFCRSMTIATSGIAYFLAVWCVYLIGGRVRLPMPVRLALAASFALATVALPYTRHVNNHILFLGVAAGLTLHLVYLAEESLAGNIPKGRLLILGTLAGLAYNLDLGGGTVLLACLVPLLVYRCRRVVPILLFLAAALPWLLTHHAINYAIGGALQPMNAVPGYLDWPGSPFSTQNLTGVWRHDLLEFVIYALALLFGKQGFICHNLPLFLALGAFTLLLMRRSPERPEIIFGAAWCAGTWLMYAAFSNNYGGACCSVRWFVPFLAPGYHALALHLRRFPEQRTDFYVLSLWGGVLAAIMWRCGPWIRNLVPFYWPLVLAGLLSWLACANARRGQKRPGSPRVADEPLASRAA